MKPARIVILLVFLAVLLSFAPRAAAAGPIDDLVRVINQARAAKGLAPYALEARLSQAAQAHSDDLARAGTGMALLGHTGSDGSSPNQRIDRTGYVRAGGWGGEIWANAPSADYAFREYWQDQAHLGMILHPILREFGIGVTPSVYGYVMVVDFGAQPNVLPVFVEGGGLARDPTITLTLTNEDAIPFGDGPSRMGRAVSVRIATRPDLDNASALPYASKLKFTIANTPGIQTVYVKFSDTQGRTATSSTQVQLVGIITPAAAAPAAAAAHATSQPRTPTPTRVKPTITPTRPLQTRTVQPTETAAVIYPPLAQEVDGGPTVAEDAAGFTETPTPFDQSQAMLGRNAPMALPAAMPPESSPVFIAPYSISCLAFLLFSMSAICALSAIVLARRRRRGTGV